MPVSRSERDKPGLQWVDWALIVSYLIGAVLGTATSCLMVHDGAVLLTAAWLGNAWDIYFSQNASRAVSTLMRSMKVFGDSPHACLSLRCSVRSDVESALARFCALKLASD